MVNPKIIYILVAMVFVYIVAKFKLVPYLAARKILKDSKKNGTDAPTTAGQTPGDLLGITPAALMQMQTIMSGMTAAPAPKPPDRFDMHFDHRIVEMSDGDGNPLSGKEAGEKINRESNRFISDLAAYCIHPTCLRVSKISDGVILLYVTYDL